MLEYDDVEKTAKLRVVCGKGTYIRSLARDIGESMGSGAYITALCRSRVGKVSLKEALTLDEFHEWFEKQDVEPY